MLNFKKYNSVENVFDKEFVERIFTEGYDGLRYVVQEKVHGSNVCFVTDGHDVSFGKRTGFVEADEKFYDFEELMERYRPKALWLWNELAKKYAGLQSVSLFGEMFGGRYPHPDVYNDKRVMCIQKGVFYCPFHEFYAFDIFVIEGEKGRYLPVDEANELFERGAMLYAKTLFEGSIRECLAYPNAFPSNIAGWLGLPPIDDNVCEGVVIRPKEPVYFRTGARLLLKNKNERFAEKKSVRPHVREQHEVAYSDELAALMPLAEEYVTENRLNNVVSKIGQVSIPKDTGKLIGLFAKDVLEDFLKEHEADYYELEKADQKLLNKHVNALAVKMIKEVYFKVAIP